MKKSLTISSKLLTMDFETKTIKDVMVVICVSIYDGKNVTSLFIYDPNNSDD